MSDQPDEKKKWPKVDKSQLPKNPPEIFGDWVDVSIDGGPVITVPKMVAIWLSRVFADDQSKRDHKKEMEVMIDVIKSFPVPFPKP